MKVNQLRQLIREELQQAMGNLQQGSSEPENYMFFQNLQTINHATSEMLEMDMAKVDQILSNGHGWAADHIATSADDVEEVYHFLSAKMGGELNENRSVDEADSDLDSIISSAKELKEYDFSTLFLNYEQRKMLSQAAMILKSLVDAVDQASDEANQAGNEPDYIDEKHLTKAELKKREEVAKGLAKENPKMPMPKKMAIATSIAKKLAESKKRFK
jgi:hypothetical protein